MPRNNDDNNKRTNYSSKNDNKKSVQSDKNNQYDLIDINVKKAQDDIKKIFDSAKSELNNFHKEQEKLVKNTVDNMQKQYKDMFSNVAKDYKNAMNSINSTDNFSSGRNNNVNSGDSDVAKAADKLSESVDKKNKDDKENISASKRVLNVFTNSVKDVLTQWSNRFFSGMNRIVDTYEATYKRVSVITNTNQKNYQDWQNRVSKDLQDQGLANNVTVSQAMEEMSSITDRGITDFGKASEMSMQNIVNKVIAPYVDTTTSAYTDLQMKFGENFTNNISGMSSYLSDIAGSNRVFKNSINDVIDKLEPVQLWADKQLMSGEDYARVEALVASGQMTEKQALELVSQAAEAIENPYEALTNGTTAQKVAVATGSYLNGMDATMGSMGNVAGLSESDNAIMQGAAGTALGTLSWTGSYSDVNKIAEGLNAEIEDYGKTSEDYYKEMLNNFKNDQYNTAEELRANLAENASTWLATFKEEYPEWYTFLGSMAKGISGILGILMADKFLGGSGGSGILSGIGGKLSSAGTYIGSGLANGFSKSATTAVGAGKIGALTGTGGAIAGAAGTLAGGAMAIKGGMDVYNDFKSGDVDAGTAMSGVGAVGGAVGAGAMLALGASNPIGWVALAVGGIALAGREIYDLATQTGDISDELEQQTDARVRNIEQQNKEEEKNLEVLKGQIEQEQDIDKQKKLIAEAGIASEKELQDEQYNNRDALIALTDQYIDSAKKLNEEETDAFKELEKVQNEQQNELSKKMFEILDKSYGNMTDEDKAAAGDFAREYYENLQEKASAGTLSKDEEWRYNKINEAINKGDIDLYDDEFTSKELDYIMHKGSNSTSNDIVRSMLANQEFMTSLTGNESVRDSLGTGIYGRMDTSQVASLITEAVNAETESQARTALDSMKELGATLDNIGENNKKSIEDVMNKWGFESFAKGTDYIPYDNFPALLHKGEAVVTASGADILRGAGASSMGATGITSAIGNLFNIVATPIKEILGVSSNSGGNSSSSKEIVDAIYYQTSVLESAIKGINGNISSGNGDSANVNNKTNVLTMRTNYNNNLVNLSPSMR